MKAGAIAGIVIGIILVIIAIVIVIIIAIKKREMAKVAVPLSREWIEQKIANPEIAMESVINGLYADQKLGMSDIDKALVEKAPINWIEEIEKYNSKIQEEENDLKIKNDNKELIFDHIENEFCDREGGYPIYIATPDQFSAMVYLSSCPHLRGLLQADKGNGSYSREVRDKEGLDTAVKYYYTYKTFDPTKWQSDAAGEISIPQPSYARLEGIAKILNGFYNSSYQTFDKYLEDKLSLPEEESEKLAYQIIDLLTTNPLNYVDDLFIEQWNNAIPEKNDIRYFYRLPALYAFDKRAEDLNIQIYENL